MNRCKDCKNLLCSSEEACEMQEGLIPYIKWEQDWGEPYMYACKKVNDSLEVDSDNEPIPHILCEPEFDTKHDSLDYCFCTKNRCAWNDTGHEKRHSDICQYVRHISEEEIGISHLNQLDDEDQYLDGAWYPSRVKEDGTLRIAYCPIFGKKIPISDHAFYRLPECVRISIRDKDENN